MNTRDAEAAQRFGSVMSTADIDAPSTRPSKVQFFAVVSIGGRNTLIFLEKWSVK